MARRDDEEYDTSDPWGQAPDPWQPEPVAPQDALPTGGGWNENNPFEDQPPLTPAPLPDPGPFPDTGGHQGITDPEFRDNTPPPAPAPTPAPEQPPAAPPPEAPPTAPPPMGTDPYPSGATAGGTPGVQTLPQAVAQMYRTALGRNGSVQEIQAWISGTQGNLAAIQQGIYGSPEAQNYSRWQQSHPAAATPDPAKATDDAEPTGGQLTDPVFAAKLVAWMAKQPGVNPSVKNDPQYWIGRFGSGDFKNDIAYAKMRMMQPEGPPEGAKAAAPPPAAGPAAGPTTPPPVVPSPIPAGGNYTPPPAPPAAGAAGSPQASQAFGSDIRTQLLNLLQQAPVSEGDTDIAPAISAYRNQRTRSLREAQDQNAESANARGLLHSGAYDAAANREAELAGGDIASFAGNAVAQQALARRTQITQLLSVGAQLLTSDQAQALQAQIANIDAYLRQQSITNQYNQFYDQQAQQNAQFGVTSNNQALRTLMGL